MEIKKDALLRVVKATRMSMRMAECMRCLLTDENIDLYGNELSKWMLKSIVDI